ncbi:hypothetical protein OSTOST_23962 [Ostertagia ostertagi]
MGPRWLYGGRSITLCSEFRSSHSDGLSTLPVAALPPATSLGSTHNVPKRWDLRLFGLTVSDNGRCRSFIKRMKDDSIASRARPALAIGQLIEKIDGVNVTGMRHYEVVRILRNMPIGKT